MKVAIDQLEIDHARFNAAKTLSTSTPSEFEHTQIGKLHVTRDRTRSDSYYNRVLGLTYTTLDDLDRALSWIAEATGPRQAMRIDTSAEHFHRQALTQRSFRHVESLVWLHAFPTSHSQQARAEPAADVRELAIDDRDALRRLLEEHGPISHDVWAAKRSYLCTSSFRWFGIFDRHELVSAASMWITAAAAILGSAYTRPAWRGRGYQRQLLQHRRGAAATHLFADVEPDSVSHRNCVREGFREFERRYVWVRQQYVDCS